MKANFILEEVNVCCTCRSNRWLRINYPDVSSCCSYSLPQTTYLVWMIDEIKNWQTSFFCHFTFFSIDLHGSFSGNLFINWICACPFLVEQMDGTQLSLTGWFWICQCNWLKTRPTSYRALSTSRCDRAKNSMCHRLQVEVSLSALFLFYFGGKRRTVLIDNPTTAEFNEHRCSIAQSLWKKYDMFDSFASILHALLTRWITSREIWLDL